MGKLKTCSGCKANDFNESCSLGYGSSVTHRQAKGLFISTMTPTEECPKPRTTKELMRQYDLRIKQ